ncbi:MAG: hypothetical protein Q9199_003906 [Rusavskia elegans]
MPFFNIVIALNKSRARGLHAYLTGVFSLSTDALCRRHHIASHSAKSVVSKTLKAMTWEPAMFKIIRKTAINIISLRRSDVSSGGLIAVGLLTAKGTMSCLLKVSSAGDTGVLTRVAGLKSSGKVGKVQLRLTQSAGPISGNGLPGPTTPEQPWTHRGTQSVPNNKFPEGCRGIVARPENIPVHAPPADDYVVFPEANVGLQKPVPQIIVLDRPVATKSRNNNDSLPGESAVAVLKDADDSPEEVEPVQALSKITSVFTLPSQTNSKQKGKVKKRLYMPKTLPVAGKDFTQEWRSMLKSAGKPQTPPSPSFVPRPNGKMDNGMRWLSELLGNRGHSSQANEEYAGNHDCLLSSGVDFLFDSITPDTAGNADTTEADLEPITNNVEDLGTAACVPHEPGIVSGPSNTPGVADVSETPTRDLYTSTLYGIEFSYESLSCIESDDTSTSCSSDDAYTPALESPLLSVPSSCIFVDTLTKSLSALRIRSATQVANPGLRSCLKHGPKPKKHVTIADTPDDDRRLLSQLPLDTNAPPNSPNKVSLDASERSSIQWALRTAKESARRQQEQPSVLPPEAVILSCSDDPTAASTPVSQTRDSPVITPEDQQPAEFNAPPTVPSPLPSIALSSAPAQSCMPDASGEPSEIMTSGTVPPSPRHDSAEGKRKPKPSFPAYKAATRKSPTARERHGQRSAASGIGSSKTSCPFKKQGAQAASLTSDNASGVDAGQSITLMPLPEVCPGSSTEPQSLQIPSPQAEIASATDRERSHSSVPVQESILESDTNPRSTAPLPVHVSPAIEEQPQPMASGPTDLPSTNVIEDKVATSVQEPSPAPLPELLSAPREEKLQPIASGPTALPDANVTENEVATSVQEPSIAPLPELLSAPREDQPQLIAPGPTILPVANAVEIEVAMPVQEPPAQPNHQEPQQFVHGASMITEPTTSLSSLHYPEATFQPPLDVLPSDEMDFTYDGGATQVDADGNITMSDEGYDSGYASNEDLVAVVPADGIPDFMDTDEDMCDVGDEPELLQQYSPEELHYQQYLHFEQQQFYEQQQYFQQQQQVQMQQQQQQQQQPPFQHQQQLQQPQQQQIPQVDQPNTEVAMNQETPPLYDSRASNAAAREEKERERRARISKPRTETEQAHQPQAKQRPAHQQRIRAEMSKQTIGKTPAAIDDETRSDKKARETGCVTPNDEEQHESDDEDGIPPPFGIDAQLLVFSRRCCLSVLIPWTITQQSDNPTPQIIKYTPCPPDLLPAIHHPGNIYLNLIGPPFKHTQPGHEVLKGHPELHPPSNDLVTNNLLVHRHLRSTALRLHPTSYAFPPIRTRRSTSPTSPSNHLPRPPIGTTVEIPYRSPPVDSIHNNLLPASNKRTHRSHRQLRRAGKDATNIRQHMESHPSSPSNHPRPPTYRNISRSSHPPSPTIIHAALPPVATAVDVTNILTHKPLSRQQSQPPPTPASPSPPVYQDYSGLQLEKRYEHPTPPQKTQTQSHTATQQVHQGY